MRDVATAKSPLFFMLAAAISIAVSALGIYGYRAVREWRRSAATIADRASQDGADLLVTALTRDMRGAQALVLANRDAGDYATQALPDFSSEVSAAFTRFPYPESFFGWRATDGDVVFFNRANRQPPWSGVVQSGHYPVVVARNPAIAPAVLAQILVDAHKRRTYSDFRVPIAGTAYEVVARLQYADQFRDRLASVSGFTVNLDWARRWYFGEIVSQVARIGSRSVTLDYAIVDDKGQPIIGTLSADATVVRPFPMQFFDPSTSELFTDGTATPPVWTVRVNTASTADLVWATRGADWTLLGIGTTTFALVLSFFLLTNAVRTSASVAAMRNEFVATVTHEIKTPIATIRAIADTMRRGRLDGGGIREYAGLLVQESRRLARLVDNLLAYARVTDISDVYSDERVAPAELIEESIRGFQQQLTDGRFDVVAEVPHDLPLVRGDRTALRLALDNLIDNAIRYSTDQHWIRVAARRSDSRIVIEVRDHGVGIAREDIQRVQRKFVRGHANRTHGSGLGLAIVHRVAAHHEGRFELQSEPGIGTTAVFDVPICGD